VVEVREARYFVAVAEELHFGRAAARLHMSQPPLSQAVRGLEERLGTVLLHRTTRTVALTPAGVAFLGACRKVVSASEAAAAVARAGGDGQAGRLRIGAVSSAVTDLLPDLLGAFRLTHPRVEVRVEEADTREAVEAVRRRDLDVALVRQLATPAECERITLRSEPFVLAVPAAWSLPGSDISEGDASSEGVVIRAVAPLVDLASAADLPWIWLPRQIAPDYHDQVVACCRAAGFAPDPAHTARSITSQLAMVSSGLGVALVPAGSTILREDSPASSVSWRSINGSASIELAAVWHRTSDPLVHAFVERARAAAAR